MTCSTVPSQQFEAARRPLAGVRLQNLWHRYPCRGAGSPEAWTLQAIDLELAEGELVGLLGPSGCGKTTLLRLIAGFERPERGSVSIDGQSVAGGDRWLEPERRGVGMVFQDHALFPHLDAWANACFGMRRRHDRERARWLLSLLGLGGLECRYPHELSGGQRQRLALARALAPDPSVLLLDEPFSNLDVEVRHRLRSELPEVLDRCGTSCLIVTHDPEEALAICDRVGVLQEGRLHQCCSPRDLVEEPASAFVGRFVLQANLVPARWDGQLLATPLGPLPCQDPRAAIGRATPGADFELMVAVDGLSLVPDRAGPAVVRGREFLGNGWLYRVDCAGLHLRLRLPLEVDLPGGVRGVLGFRPEARWRLFPADSSFSPSPSPTI